MCKKIIAYSCSYCPALRKTYDGIQKHENGCKEKNKEFIKQKLKLTKDGELKRISDGMGT
jgi:hypothetical protein